MAKKGKSNKGGKGQPSPRLAVRTGPNWPLFGIALVGIALTGYLTIKSWTGESVAGCTVGSACDVVLNSNWATLFGVPTSLWGFLVYAGLAGVAWIKRADTHWKRAWTLSLFGVLYSAYLTLIAIFGLKAACPYCLTSFGLFVVIFVTVIFQRPAEMPRFSWQPWLLKTITAGLVLVFAIHLHYAGLWGKSLGAEDPYLRGLADHLAKSDAKFYGAYWCPHCAEQKAYFGASAKRLPYIECSPLGPNARQAAVCDAQHVDTYPTWVIKGQRHVGVQSPNDLAQYSGFKGAQP